MLTIFFIYPFFFLSNNILRNRLLSSYGSHFFKICIHVQMIVVYCVKQNHDAEVYFAFFISASFVIAYSDEMHREIRIK